MKIKGEIYAIVGLADPAEPSVYRVSDGVRSTRTRGPRWQTNLPVLDLATPRFRAGHSPAVSCT